MNKEAIGLFKYWIKRASVKEDINKYPNIMAKVTGDEVMQNGEYYIVYEVKVKTL